MVIVLLLVAIVGVAAFARGQDMSASDSGQMKALVSEVRALRVAIERAAASNAQSQVLLGRVQLQENRLATLSRQYQEARTRTLDSQTAQTGLEHELQRTQAAESGTPRPPEERQALEQRITQLKSQVAHQQARTAQLRADETATADMLAMEQQRWADFNQRLEGIERTLSDSLSGR
jgi:flagellar biosynthesis/type III secretory pathway chaperone